MAKSFRRQETFFKSSDCFVELKKQVNYANTFSSCDMRTISTKLVEVDK